MAGKRKKEDIRIRFGRRVRELRKERGWSQEVLAGKCGLNRSYLSEVEGGGRNVSLENIEVLADALGISVGELFREL